MDSMLNPNEPHISRTPQNCTYDDEGCVTHTYGIVRWKESISQDTEGIIFCAFDESLRFSNPEHGFLICNVECGLLMSDDIPELINDKDGLPTINWMELTSPESQPFISALNKAFNLNMKLEDFPGR